MTSVVDREGRLFGRVNLFDAAVVAFVLLLVPIAYVAFLLFRTPRPQITAVEPAQLTYIEDRAARGTELSGKIKVRGANLRPVLRAMIGNQDAVAFIFENPSSADVLVGNVASGTHDLVLYDGVQEVARAPKAVTIPPKVSPASARVWVVGTLVDLDRNAAESLRVGAKYPARGAPQAELAEIVALGDPVPDVRTVKTAAGAIELPVIDRWQRDAAIAMACDVSVPDQCRSEPVSLTGASVLLNVPGSDGALRLRVHELVPATPPHAAQARVRFLVPSDAADLIRPSDRDESAPPVDGRAATIVAVEGRQIVQGDVTVSTAGDAAQPTTTLRAADRVAAVDALVQLGVDGARDGWRYRTQSVRVGEVLTFLTPRYTARGVVRSLTVSDGSGAAPQRRR